MGTAINHAVPDGVKPSFVIFDIRALVVWHFAIDYLADDCRLVVDARCCVPQRTEHASRRGHSAPLATERCRLLDPDYGTVFRRT